MGRRNPQYHSETYIKAPYDLKFTVNKKHQIHRHLKQFSIDSLEAQELIEACKKIHDLRSELSKYTTHFLKTRKGSALKRELGRCKDIISRHTEDELQAFCDHLKRTSLTREFSTLRPASLQNGIPFALLDNRPTGVIIPAGTKMFVTPTISKTFKTSRDYKRTHLIIVLDTGSLLIPVSMTTSSRADIARNGTNVGMEVSGTTIRRSRVDNIDIITASRHIEAIDRALIEGKDFSFNNPFAPKAKIERPIVLSECSDEFFYSCSAPLSEAAEAKITEISDMLRNTEAEPPENPTCPAQSSFRAGESAITRLQKIKEHRMNTPNNPSSDEEFTFDSLATSDQNDQDSKIVITSIEDGVPTIRSIEYTDGPAMTETLILQRGQDNPDTQGIEASAANLILHDSLEASDTKDADFAFDIFEASPATTQDEGISEDSFDSFFVSNDEHETGFNPSPSVRPEDIVQADDAPHINTEEFFNLEEASEDLFGDSTSPDENKKPTKRDELLLSIKDALFMGNEIWISDAIQNIEREINDLQEVREHLKQILSATKSINSFIAKRK